MVNTGQLSLYLFTFNCARLPQNSSILSAHLFSSLTPDSPSPELVVLALQELAPLSTSFIGGTLLDTYYEPFVSAVYSASRKMFSEQYTLIGKHTIGLTGILAFARRPDRVKSVDCAGTGVGVWEMGNKGGVGLKIAHAIGDGDEVVKMIFVAAHLAPDEFQVKRRNEDWESIVKNVVFKYSEYTPFEEGEEPRVKQKHGIYHPTAHLFIMGDFNYRTSHDRPVHPDYLLFPQPEDPEDAISHWKKLLEDDQLSYERGIGNVFHGFKEEAINFPPTYKYRLSPGYNESTWDWAPNRWPSWTDRILYLPLPSQPSDQEIKIYNYTSIPRINTSDHKPVALHLSIPATPLATAGKDDIRENPPFEINEDWMERRAAARKKEIVVGAVAYLFTTWAGAGIWLAIAMGLVGGYWLLKALAA